MQGKMGEIETRRRVRVRVKRRWKRVRYGGEVKWKGATLISGLLWLIVSQCFIHALVNVMCNCVHVVRGPIPNTKCSTSTYSVLQYLRHMYNFKHSQIKQGVEVIKGPFAAVGSAGHRLTDTLDFAGKKQTITTTVVQRGRWEPCKQFYLIFHSEKFAYGLWLLIT